MECWGRLETYRIEQESVEGCPRNLARQTESTKLYKARADPMSRSGTLPKRKERGRLTGQSTAFNRISKNGR